MSFLRRYWPGVGFAFLVALIMGPVLVSSGYLFLLDMVWAPHVTAHVPVSSNLPISFLLQALSYVIPADLLQKLLLCLVLWAAGYLAYRLVNRFTVRHWAFVGGVIYLVNPFVYERLVAGQWQVLAGYALLPLLIESFAHWLARPRVRNWLKFIGLLGIYPLISVHFAYMAVFFLAFYGLVYSVIKRPKWDWVNQKSLAYGLLLPAAVIVVNAFWVLGSSSTDTIGHLRASDLQAFKTASDPTVGVFGNVLNLYGFWFSEYFLPKDFVSVWWVCGFALAIKSIYGFWVAAKRRLTPGIAIGLWGLIAVWLAVGVASPLTAPTTNFLANHLPGYVGLRDTGKWIAWIALSYAILVPLAGESIEKWLTDRKVAVQANIVMPGAVLIVVLLASSSLFWGVSGQLKPAQYPAGWAAAKRELIGTGSSKALVLPWHEYIKVNFAGNRYVSNPARGYFGDTVVTSSRTDNIFLDERQRTETDHEVNELLGEVISPDQFVAWLKGQGYTNILVERTDDVSAYEPLLADAKLLKRVSASQGISLYRLR